MKKEEEKIVAIPESITINGVTYSVRETPELQTFIQSVSKVEKTKLYSQFEALKNQISTLSNTTIETPSAPFDVNQLKQEISDGLVKTLMPQLSATISDIVKPMLVATAESKKTELDNYKEKLINENSAVCIPDLVKGNSKEEMDASLKESIRIRSAYPPAHTIPQGKTTDPLLVKQVSETQVAPIATPIVAPITPSPTIPTIPNIPAIPMTTQQDVKKMSMEEFSKQRETLLAGLNSVLE